MPKKMLMDTNVILVANIQHEQASIACIRACTELIQAVHKGGYLVLVDDQDGHSWILSEYQNKTQPWSYGSQRVGDLFVRSLLQGNHAGSAVLEKVAITGKGPCDPDGEPRDYSEFPVDGRLTGFDHADRKFVAVASSASKPMPVIHVAVDAGFLQHKDVLHELGFKVKFLCPADIRAFRRAPKGS